MRTTTYRYTCDFTDCESYEEFTLVDGEVASFSLEAPPGWRIVTEVVRWSERKHIYCGKHEITVKGEPVENVYVFLGKEVVSEPKSVMFNALVDESTFRALSVTASERDCDVGELAGEMLVQEQNLIDVIQEIQNVVEKDATGPNRTMPESIIYDMTQGALGKYRGK